MNLLQKRKVIVETALNCEEVVPHSHSTYDMSHKSPGTDQETLSPLNFRDWSVIGLQPRPAELIYIPAILPYMQAKCGSNKTTFETFRIHVTFLTDTLSYQIDC